MQNGLAEHILEPSVHLRPQNLLAIMIIVLGVAPSTMSFLPTAAVFDPPSPFFQQASSSTPYLTLFKLQGPGLSPIPFVLFPISNKTVWVDTVKLGQPFISQLVNFTVGATPQIVLNLTDSVSSIIADKEGRVWIAGSGLSYYDPAVKKAYNLTTFQGTNPQFMAFDNAGRLWITLLGSNSIGMYNSSTGQTVTYPLPTSGAIPQGITLATDGMIWFTEAGSQKLARLDPNTSNITEYSSPLKLIAPIHVAVDNSGLVWFTDHGSNEFGSFNPKTGEWSKYPIGYCPGNECVLGLPNEMFVDQEGRIWFSEHIGGRIAEYDPVSDVLTEYIIPVPVGLSSEGFAYAWWASPGPGNLVWFTAFGYGEIGYVNSSIPVNSNVGTTREVMVERGLTAQLSVTVNHESQGTVSLGVNPSYLDRSDSQPSISGTFIQNVLPGSGFVTATIGITAAWNAQDGPHVAMVTASDGQVAVSVPVTVSVVEPILIYLAIAGASSLVTAALVLYVRRGRRRGVGLPIAGQP